MRRLSLPRRSSGKSPLHGPRRYGPPAPTSSPVFCTYSGEKRVALELYRRFRRHLFDLGVVSLDRATQPLALPRLSAISAPCTSAGRVGMPEPRGMNIAVFMEEVMPINGLL